MRNKRRDKHIIKKLKPNKPAKLMKPVKTVFKTKKIKKLIIENKNLNEATVDITGFESGNIPDALREAMEWMERSGALKASQEYAKKQQQEKEKKEQENPEVKEVQVDSDKKKEEFKYNFNQVKQNLEQKKNKELIALRRQQFNILNNVNVKNILNKEDEIEGEKVNLFTEYVEPIVKMRLEGQHNYDLLNEKTKKLVDLYNKYNNVILNSELNKKEYKIKTAIRDQLTEFMRFAIIQQILFDRRTKNGTDFSYRIANENKKKKIKQNNKELSEMNNKISKTILNNLNESKQYKEELNSISERNEPADSQAARELKLFIENDALLYENQYLYIVRNMQRKIKKGIFDETKVKDAMIHLVNHGAQKYAREYGDQPWHVMFNMATRKMVAEEMADELIDQLKNDEFSELTESKKNEGFMGDLLRKKGFLKNKNRKLDQPYTMDDLTDKAKDFLKQGFVYTISALAGMGLAGSFLSEYQDEQNVKEEKLLKDLVKERVIQTPKDLKIAKIYIDTGREVKNVDINDDDEQEFLELVHDVNVNTHIQPENLPDDIYNFDDHYYESRKALLERNEPLDEDLAWELKMFIENDEQLYNNMFLYIVRNMKRKIKRGIFDENKVKDAMLHLVNAGAQKCTKDYHKRGKWFEVFSMATRKDVAQDMADELIDALKNNEYDDV